MSGVDTHCPYCALQCAMGLDPTPAATEDGLSPGARQLPLVTVSGRDFPTNRGGLCHKGWTSASVLTAADRLTTPLLRDCDGRLNPASWEEAYDRIVAGVARARQACGDDGIAVFGGGGLTNEKAYTLGKFARVALRTRLIDYNGRFCMSSAAAANNRSFGMDRGLPFPVTDLDSAPLILLIGSNLADTMPPLVSHLAGARAAGGLVVVDPRRSATAALTDEGAGVHLRNRPGTDLALLLGIAHEVIATGGHDRDYLRARVDGVAEVVAQSTLWWPERTERVTGVPATRFDWSPKC